MYLFRSWPKAQESIKQKLEKRDIYLLHFYLSTQYLIPNHGPNLTEAAY